MPFSLYPILIVTIGFFGWSCLLAYKFAYFGFYDWDLALYSQAMWSLCHGTTVVSLFGTNFLADHAHYISFLILPIYKVFSHPLTLINLELLSFFGGAFLLYKIAEKIISPFMALLLMVIYIVHPANIFMLLYEFHFESLAIGLIFLMFYLYQNNRYIAFLITACVVMLVKENMSLLVLMMGIYGFLLKKEDRVKWGLVPFLMGLGYFLLVMFVITPWLRQDLSSGQNIYWTLYGKLGDKPQSILTSLVFNPAKVVALLFTPENRHFLLNLFSAFGLAAFFSPLVLLINTPLFLQNMLSGMWTQHTIYFHYAATMLPLIAIAAAYGLQWLHRQFPILTRGILVLMVLVTMAQVFYFSDTIKFKVSAWVDSKDILRQHMVDQIPPQAGVVAGFDFLSHLSHRKDVYAFYNVWRGINYFTSRNFILPASVHYALIDFNDPWLLADLEQNRNFTKSKVKEFFSKGDWKVKYAQQGIVLYQR